MAREWSTAGRLAEGEETERMACGTLNSLVCCVTEGELVAESMVVETLYAGDGERCVWSSHARLAEVRWAVDIDSRDGPSRNSPKGGVDAVGWPRVSEGSDEGDGLAWRGVGVARSLRV